MMRRLFLSTSRKRKSKIFSAPAAACRSSKENVAECGVFARMLAEENGGMTIRTSERRTKMPFTNIPVRPATMNLAAMATSVESIAVMTATSNQDFGMVMKMEFRKLPIESLIPAQYNPRKKLKPGDPEFEKIKNSINEFGYVDPVIVNKDLTVIGGHQRISVLMTLGFTEIDCVVIDIDKTKEKALNVALNKIGG